MQIYYLEDNHENYHDLEVKERVLETSNYLKKKFPKKYFISEKEFVYDTNHVLNYIMTVYSEKYLNLLKKDSYTKDKYIKLDEDTHLTEFTLGEIIKSNALIIKALNDIITKNIKYGYCIVRPPSHHASQDHYSGFCMINNTYLAAEYAEKNLNGKVLIIDWDLHHGDGTEKLVRTRNNQNIHFISIHCFAKGFYPGTGNGKNDTDRIKNYPMKKYCSDNEYNEKFEEIYNQIQLNDYKLIIISNGLDAHENDSFSVMKLSTEFYKNASVRLKSFNIPLLYILEGGYNIEVLQEVSEEIIKVLQNKNISNIQTV